MLDRLLSKDYYGLISQIHHVPRKSLKEKRRAGCARLSDIGGNERKDGVKGSVSRDVETLNTFSMGKGRNLLKMGSQKGA